MRVIAVNIAIALLIPLTAAAAVRPSDDLVAAVAAALPEGVGEGDTQVTVQRRAHGWAFGAAVRPTPHGADTYPDGWLWVAHDDGGWHVAVEGTVAFAALGARAEVLDATEQATLGAMDPARPAGPRLPAPRTPESHGTDYRTGMRLPFAVGQSWRLTGGPHPMNGGLWSSLDFAGGDGRVLAARDGVAYTMCESGTGWLRVVHDDGFATDYYHLEDNIRAEGTPVSEGDFLGMIGTDVSCGGSATGPHVHFSLRRDGQYVAIERYNFGKWSFHSADRPYQGYALHGSTRVNVGEALHNHGALGATEGVVDTNGGGVLNRRAGPGTDHEVVGTVGDGQTVRVECSQRGTTHTGRFDYTSDLWNRLADGGWVSDVYLWTGTGDPVAGWCD